MLKRTLAAFAAFTLSAAALSAATVTGPFLVTAVHVDSQLNRTESQATAANFNDAFQKAVDGEAGYSRDVFEYEGELDFGTFDRTDATTIADWLATGTPGGLRDLDSSFGALQLSAPNIGNGTATTTFFLFSEDDFVPTGPGKLTIMHDDGVLAGSLVALNPTSPSDRRIQVDTTYAAFAGPNGQRTTTGFFDDSGFFDVLYVATNGDPSVLKVDVTAVPLPAGLPLLLIGLGSIAALRRRQRAQ